MKKRRILLIAADDPFAATVRTSLLRGQYQVWRARDGTEGVKKMSACRPDLVVIERGLPLINRQDPCQRIRQAGYLPIVVVGTGQDAVDMLEIGADAYVPRSAGVRELLARVSSLLWRKSRAEDMTARPAWPLNMGRTGGNRIAAKDSTRQPAEGPAFDIDSAGAGAGGSTTGAV